MGYPIGITLKGNQIVRYALKQLAQMHRIGEDQQIHRTDIKTIDSAIKYLTVICNFPFKDLIELSEDKQNDYIHFKILN